MTKHPAAAEWTRFGPRPSRQQAGLHLRLAPWLLLLFACGPAGDGSSDRDRTGLAQAPGGRSDQGIGVRTVEAAHAESFEGGEITYHNRISRIVQQRCERCHREGAAAPFALSDYASVKKKRRMIRWVIEQGVMPPWFADEGSGPWSNDASLSGAERSDLLSWLDSGNPEGDAADAPPPVDWPHGWTIGEPDHVVEVEESFQVPADGVVQYQHFWVKTDFPEDRWVRALEIQAGEPQVVHHILTFIEDPELYERKKAGDQEARRLWQGGKETYFAGMVPGQSAIVFPEGMGKLLPAGAWIKFQIHYTPNGSPATDRSRMGMIFHDAPVEREIRTSSANNQDFAIPPGAQDFEVEASYLFEEDALLLSLCGHTHLRGTRFLYRLAFPDGRIESLIDMNPYDFNWQVAYQFETPVAVPSGTRLLATTWYDNSASNPANPDPTATVRWGNQTFAEMMIGYFDWIPAPMDQDAAR